MCRTQSTEQRFRSETLKRDTRKKQKGLPAITELCSVGTLVVPPAARSRFRTPRLGLAQFSWDANLIIWVC